MSQRSAEVKTITPRPRRFRLASAGELLSIPSPPQWLIKGVIEANSLVLLFGDPGSAKSLMALHMASHISTGNECFGYQTTKGLVIYIAGEGYGGISRRLKAIEEASRISIARSPLYVSRSGAELITVESAIEVSEAVDAIAIEHGNPVLVVIDTLHRNLGPGDESSSGDIARVLVNVDALIRERYGCAVLIVHHAGHGDKTRARGSSSLRAAVDTEFRMALMPGGMTEFSCTKAKDAEPIKPMMFAIKQVDLPWLDEDGETVTSVVLESRGDAPAPKLGKKLTAPQRIALEALHKAIEQHGKPPPTKEVIDNSSIGLGTNVVHVDEWRDMAYAMGISDSGQDARRKAFSRARMDLIGYRKVDTWADYCWPSRSQDKTGQTGTLST